MSLFQFSLSRRAAEPDAALMRGSGESLLANRFENGQPIVR